MAFVILGFQDYLYIVNTSGSSRLVYRVSLFLLSLSSLRISCWTSAGKLLNSAESMSMSSKFWYSSYTKVISENIHV